MPEMLPNRGNCVDCSKRIRKSHENEFKDVQITVVPQISVAPQAVRHQNKPIHFKVYKSIIIKHESKELHETLQIFHLVLKFTLS